jgi:PAS domain S-box-containing protein
MKDVDKDTGHLIAELERLRLRIKQLEAAKAERAEAASRLIDSEIRYRRLFETAQHGILILDFKTGQVTDVNPFLERMLGYSHEEFVGKKLWEIGPFKDIEESKIVFRELQKKGYVRYENLPLQAKDGREIAVEFVSNVYKIDHTSVIQCNIRDITERKRLEEYLEKERQEFKLITRDSPIIVFYKDKDGKFMRVNRTFAEALGIPEERFLGKTVFDFYSAEIAQSMTDDDQEVLKSGRPKLNIIEHYESASGIRWAQTDKVPIFDEDGLPSGLVGFAQDITEWKKTQEALLESEAKYRELAESITDVFFAMDEKLRYTYWNKASEELTGILAKDAIGQNIYDIFPDDESTRRAVNAYRRALATKEPQHLINERSVGGRDYVFDISAYPTKDGLCVYVKDVTGRRKLEMALEESEKWYRHIFDHAPFGIGFSSIDGKVITLNKAMETITGYSAEELSKVNLADTYVDKADREILLQEIRQHSGVIDYPVQLKRKDGTPYDALLTIRLTIIGDKEFVQTICHDVTERKKAEEALKESEERYRSLVELSPEAILVIVEGRYAFINSAGLKLYGLSSLDQIVGKPVVELIHLDDREMVTARMKQVMEKGVTPTTLEGKFTRIDGTEIYGEVRIAPLTYQGKQAEQIVIRDISERKKAEEALRLSEQNFRESIENSPLGIRIIDEEGKSLYVNRALLDMYGYSSLEELEAVPRKKRYTFEGYVEHRERIRKRKRGEYVPDDYEISIVRKDGQVRYLTVLRREVLWNGEKQFQVVYQNITERKAREQEYQAIIRTTIDGFWQADMQGHFLDVNQAYCQLIGYSRDELLNMSISDVEAIETLGEIAGRIQKIEKVGYDRFESRHRRKDGETVDVEISVNYLPINGGRMFIFIRDITQRKRAEAEMRTKDYAMASAISGILLLDLNGVVLYANKVYLDMWGYKNIEEAIGHNITELAANKDLARMLLANVITGEGWRGELETPVRDGRTIYILLSASIVRDEKSVPIGIMASTIDITERNQAQKQLQQEKDRAQQYLDIAGVMLIANDSHGRVSMINRKGCEVLGYEQEEIIGKNWFDKLIPKRARSEVKAVFQKLMVGEVEPIAYFENPVLTKTGEERIIAWHNVILKDAAGNIIGTLSSGEDVTQQKEAEEALRTSETHYRLLAENVRDVIWATDMDLRFTYVSPSVKYLGDRTAEEVMTMSLGQLLTPFSQELAMKTFAEELVMANVKPFDPNRSRTLEVELIRPDGSILWAELKMNFLRGPDGRPEGILGVMRDIDERKKSEEERRALEQKTQLASRLASIGELASGIAHEINNPLTGVIGYAELLMQEDVPEHIKKDLEVIHEGAQRVAGIVKGLLKFARQSRPERVLVNINEIIEVTLRLRAYELETSNIKVTTNLADELPLIVADPGQLQQVFLNLIINAEMEMRLSHSRGKLTIKTKSTDNTIRICFKDNGPGVAEENLEKIFDPFFTTREAGQGTGLGLSICHGIITEHGGRIWVESQSGKGATFIVELPIVLQKKRTTKRLSAARRPRRATRAKILVVDDEPTVRQLLSQILTGEGHVVEATDDGEDALNRIKHNGYDLILVDMRLPGMSGSELYEHIQAAAGSLVHRVVLVTGDVMSADTEAFIARTKVPCITKPFNVKRLKAEINRLLTAIYIEPTAKSTKKSKQKK